jgi:hypothetical protein
MCGSRSAGSIVGAIINQTNTTISDLEVELSIFTRDKEGQLTRQGDTRFVVIPSVNQAGIVTTLQPNGDVSFNIPGRYGGDDYGVSYSRNKDDRTCFDPSGEIPNVAALSSTRINGKSLLLTGGDGKPLKQAPIESMLQVPRETPKRDHVPTQFEVIQEIRGRNELLCETIINKQLQDCLARGAWACSFNNETNINVVISQQ